MTKFLKNYSINETQLNVDDLITLSDRKIMIKEIFEFNDFIYISYDDTVGSGLMFDKVNDFYEKYSPFFETKIKIERGGSKTDKIEGI